MEHRRGGKYAEKTERPLSSSASFRSLAVQIFCWPGKGAPQRREVRRENQAPAVFLCILPISCGSSFLLARKWSTAEEGSTQRKPSTRCLPLHPSDLLRFKFSCWPEKGTPQRGEVRRENRAPAVFLCVLPISCGSNFLLARKRSTAEGGSTPRKPSTRCLPLRPSDLSRFKFSCWPGKGTPQRGEVRRENWATAVFLCVLPISCGLNFDGA